MTRQQTDYNTVVGYNADGDAVILNYTFDHGDGFKGATGAILELVTKEAYAERTTRDALEDYWEDIYEEQRQRGQVGQRTTLRGWIRSLGKEAKDGMFDASYREFIPADAPAHKTTNCIAGGRIFPGALDDLVVMLQPTLVTLIREIEGSN